MCSAVAVTQQIGNRTSMNEVDAESNHVNISNILMSKKELLYAYTPVLVHNYYSSFGSANISPGTDVRFLDIQ